MQHPKMDRRDGEIINGSAAIEHNHDEQQGRASYNFANTVELHERKPYKRPDRLVEWIGFGVVAVEHRDRFLDLRSTHDATASAGAGH